MRGRGKENGGGDHIERVKRIGGTHHPAVQKAGWREKGTAVVAAAATIFGNPFHHDEPSFLSRSWGRKTGRSWEVKIPRHLWSGRHCGGEVGEARLGVLGVYEGGSCAC